MELNKKGIVYFLFFSQVSTPHINLKVITDLHDDHEFGLTICACAVQCFAVYLRDLELLEIMHIIKP